MWERPQTETHRLVQLEAKLSDYIGMYRINKFVQPPKQDKMRCCPWSPSEDFVWDPSTDFISLEGDFSFSFIFTHSFQFRTSHCDFNKLDRWPWEHPSRVGWWRSQKSWIIAKTKRQKKLVDHWFKWRRSGCQ